jgi:hypothetical protein
MTVLLVPLVPLAEGLSTTRSTNGVSASHAVQSFALFGILPGGQIATQV